MGLATLPCNVVFPPDWCTVGAVDTALEKAGDPHRHPDGDVTLRFPPGSKMIIDAAVRVLSLANQLILATHRVRLVFEEGMGGLMGYLDRVGFFDSLAPEVEVVPSRPVRSGAVVYRGNNAGLVEIGRINKDLRDEKLPGRLADAVKTCCSQRSDVVSLSQAAFTIFAELIDNVFLA